MVTYLLPVARTLEEARAIASRMGRAPSQSFDRKGWFIRKNYDGFYVVPAGDCGYDSVGTFVESV